VIYPLPTWLQHISSDNQELEDNSHLANIVIITNIDKVKGVKNTCNFSSIVDITNINCNHHSGLQSRCNLCRITSFCDTILTRETTNRFVIATSGYVTFVDRASVPSLQLIGRKTQPLSSMQESFVQRL